MRKTSHRKGDILSEEVQNNGSNENRKVYRTPSPTGRTHARETGRETRCNEQNHFSLGKWKLYARHRNVSKEFHVSINDLLAGEKIPDEDFRQKADENIIAVAASSAFSFDERKTYFKKKWRKEHISLFVIIGLILIAALIIPFVIHKPWLIGLLPILAVVGHCYQHNKMMIYVENNLYH